MTANNEAQASTHNRARTLNTLSHTLFADLPCVSKGIVRDKLISRRAPLELRDYRECRRTINSMKIVDGMF